MEAKMSRRRAIDEILFTTSGTLLPVFASFLKWLRLQPGERDADLAEALGEGDTTAIDPAALLKRMTEWRKLQGLEKHSRGR